jgi:hypothetical protein
LNPRYGFEMSIHPVGTEKVEETQGINRGYR